MKQSPFLKIKIYLRRWNLWALKIHKRGFMNKILDAYI